MEKKTYTLYLLIIRTSYACGVDFFMKLYANDRQEIVRMYLKNDLGGKLEEEDSDALEYTLDTMEFESEKDANNVCQYMNQYYAGKERPDEGIYALVEHK